TKAKDHLPNLASYCPGEKYLSLIYVHPIVVEKDRDDRNSDKIWDKESDSELDCSPLM
ncbi:hypothetical protein BX616_004540, partial [Lobosporangium transversale]